MLLLGLVLAAGLSVPAVPGGAADGATGTDGSAIQVAGVVAAETADDDNETAPHRHPDEYDGDGGADALADWFENQLGEQLGEGAIRLSQGEYDRASQLLGEEYQDRFESYVEVAGDTDRESRTETYENAREEQDELTEKAKTYEETKAEYERARQEGDDERARELARELDELAAAINASSTSLRDHYAAIEADTGVDLGGAIAAIETIDREIRVTQADIRDAEFVETELTIDAASEQISFLDPLIAAGRLATAEGDPVADEVVRIDVGNQSLSAETDASGGFDLEYRPISVPLSAESVSIAYVPDDGSAYLGSTTNASVSIEQEAPSVAEPVVEPDAVALGDELRVGTAVTVDGEPVDGLPLVVTAGGQELGVLETRDGTLNGTASVPPTVPDGERELRVELPFEDRALAGAAASTTVTIEETEPTLSVSATRTGDREVTVNGTLTAAGDGIGDQSVELQVAGSSVGTATTEADGTFGETVPIPESAAAGEVEVVASYDEAETNLAATTATASVTFPAADAGGSSVPAWALLGLGGLAALGLGAWTWRYRRDRRSGTDPAAAEVVYRDDTTSRTRSVDPSPTVRALLSLAGEERSAGEHDASVQTAYAAARRELESADGDRRALTHWEFYRRRRDRESAVAEPLRALTEAFERAAFGPESVTDTESARAVRWAREVCGLDAESSDREAEPPDVPVADD